MTPLFINLGFFEMLVPFLLWFVLFIIAFVKCVSNKQFSPTEKGIWLLLIFIFPLFGAIAYLVSFRRTAQSGI